MYLKSSGRPRGIFSSNLWPTYSTTDLQKPLDLSESRQASSNVFQIFLKVPPWLFKGFSLVFHGFSTVFQRLFMVFQRFCSGFSKVLQRPPYSTKDLQKPLTCKAPTLHIYFTGDARIFASNLFCPGFHEFLA